DRRVIFALCPHGLAPHSQASHLIRSGALPSMANWAGLCGRQWAGDSTAGHAHMPGDGRPLVLPVDDEIMALRLAADRLVDGGVERHVAFRCTQRCTQVGGVVLAETHE